MDIEKSNENFKNRKPKCFNCNKYEYIAKKCQLKKKEQETRKFFKCNKEEHIVKDCKGIQLMKKHKIQEESNNEDKEKEQSFKNDLEYTQYKRSSM